MRGVIFTFAVEKSSTKGICGPRCAKLSAFLTTAIVEVFNRSKRAVIAQNVRRPETTRTSTTTVTTIATPSVCYWCSSAQTRRDYYKTKTMFECWNTFGVWARFYVIAAPLWPGLISALFPRPQNPFYEILSYNFSAPTSTMRAGICGSMKDKT